MKKICLILVFAALLTCHAPAHAADTGFITAKTWIDPANSHAAAGNGSTDDYQNLQDMVNFALAHNEAVQFEPGVYRITKTLILQLPHYNDQIVGFRLSGIAGPDPYGQTGGVSLTLDAASAAQPAVLEIGQGAFYDMTIENLGLSSKVPKHGTKYGLYFAEQEFSHVNVHMVTADNVGTCFAIIQGKSGGGNGEAVSLDNCTGNGDCFYSNNCGQAFYHRLTNCGCFIYNGGTAIKIGQGNLGFGLDAFSFSCTFGSGPKRNTFVENDGISGCVSVSGGRIEWCDTLLTYNGGSYNLNGHVEIRGMDLNFGVGHFPLLDATLNGTLKQSNGQYTNTITNCTLNGAGGAITLASLNGDLSTTYFEKCTFGSFSNKLTDAPNLSQMGVIVRDCRTPLHGKDGIFVNMP